MTKQVRNYFLPGVEYGHPPEELAAG